MQGKRGFQKAVHVGCKMVGFSRQDPSSLLAFRSKFEASLFVQPGTVSDGSRVRARGYVVGVECSIPGSGSGSGVGGGEGE